MTVLKAPGPQAPKERSTPLWRVLWGQLLQTSSMLLFLSFEGKIAECELPMAKFCMIWYPPTWDKLLAALKFDCAVPRAPGPAQFYCHSPQVTWFNDHQEYKPSCQGSWLSPPDGRRNTLQRTCKKWGLEKTHLPPIWHHKANSFNILC